jgi:hypothetical protein
MGDIKLNPIMVAANSGAPGVASGSTVEPQKPKKKTPDSDESKARTSISSTGLLPSRVSLHFSAMTGLGESIDPNKMDPRRSVVLNEVGGSRYGAGLRLEGNGQVLPSTYLTWAYNLNYNEIMDFKRYISSDYDMTLVNPYFVVRGWLGYEGVNVFGLNLLNGKSSVINNIYKTRGSPDIQDDLYGSLNIGVPITVGDGMIMPFGGIKAERSMIDYYQLTNGDHLLQEVTFEGGVNGRTGNGWTYQVSGGWGTRSEDTIFASQSNLPQNNFFKDLQNPVSGDIYTANFFVKTPQFGPASYSVAGNYRQYVMEDTTQWGIKARAYFGQWDVGANFQHNYVLWVGPNDLLSVDARIPFNLGREGSRLGGRIDLNPGFQVIKTYDGKTAYFLTISTEGWLGSAGGRSPSGSGSPTLIRDDNRGE